MKKTKLYLDTSVPSFLFADDSPDKRAITVKFWNLLKTGVFDSVISDILLIEINRANDSLSFKLKDAIADLSPAVIYVNEEITVLAQKYVEAKIVPERFFDDALHMACATYVEVDAIVSWNFKHFVNLKTIRGINGVNRMIGLKEIEILSPQSWIEEE